MFFYKQLKQLNYNIKVLLLMVFVCSVSIMPLLTFEFANTIFEPSANWLRVYNGYTPYLMFSCLLLGMYLTIKCENFVTKKT